MTCSTVPRVYIQMLVEQGSAAGSHTNHTIINLIALFLRVMFVIGVARKVGFVVIGCMQCVD